MNLEQRAFSWSWSCLIVVRSSTTTLMDCSTQSPCAFPVYRLQRTTRGFYGQLPDRDDTYPRYLVRFWRNRVAEFGDLLEPTLPSDDETQRRVIPSASVVEYTHDFLLLAQRVYRLVGYGGAVEAEARLENVAGYTLGVRPGSDLPNLRPIQEDVLAPDPWRGPVDQLDQGAEAAVRTQARRGLRQPGGAAPARAEDRPRAGRPRRRRSARARR